MASGSGGLYNLFGRSNEPNDVEFLLFYDPRMKQASITLTYGDRNSIRYSPFSIARVTKVLIHGLTPNTNDDFPSVVKDAYLENQYRNDHNIIVVNWSKLAGQNQAIWFDVTNRVQTVGARVADFLLWLHNSLQLNLYTNVHLVGHWFGAHLAGMVGNNVKNNENQIGRITALDPRDPGYFADDHVRRLQKNDAEFVDVYHTNESTVDTAKMFGHVNFFVNKATATPFVFPDNSNPGDKNAIAHMLFAQSIIDGPYGNNVTSQLRDVNPNVVLVYPRQIIVGEYCIPGTTGWFDIKHGQ